MKRIQIGGKKTNKRQQGLNKHTYGHDSVSPKNEKVYNVNHRNPAMW